MAVARSKDSDKGGQTNLSADEALGQEAHHPHALLPRRGSKLVRIGRVQHRVEHGHVARVDRRALQEEAHEGRVEGRGRRADERDAVREEEGDRGGDGLARRRVDREADLGQDEVQLVLLAERERLRGREARESARRAWTQAMGSGEYTPGWS